jgi:arsenite methyltransferase
MTMARADRDQIRAAVAARYSFAEYRSGLTRAGFAGITITPTHQVADGVHAAIIRAARP